MGLKIVSEDILPIEKGRYLSFTESTLAVLDEFKNVLFRDKSDNFMLLWNEKKIDKKGKLHISIIIDHRSLELHDHLQISYDEAELEELKAEDENSELPKSILKLNIESGEEEESTWEYDFIFTDKEKFMNFSERVCPGLNQNIQKNFWRAIRYEMEEKPTSKRTTYKKWCMKARTHHYNATKNKGY